MTRRRPAILIGIGVLVLVIVVALAFALVSVLNGEDGEVASDTTASSAEGSSNELAVGTPGGESVEGAPTQISGEPFRTCEACHPDYLSKPDPSGDLVFSHKTHIDNGVQCSTCHVPPLGHFDTPAPMMMTCLSCHEGETAPNDCKNCHRKIEEIAPGLGEPAVHLEPDAKTRKSCAKCHDVKVWCEKCHGVEMPHPAYWYSSHGDIARANQEACFRCHTQGAEFCNQCHHAGFSPTPRWAGSQHGQVVGAKGDGTCLACHEQDFCTTCHAKKGI